MPDIHPMGFIIGGGCDRLHRERSHREAAARRHVEVLITAGVLKQNGKWMRVAFIPKWGFRKTELLAGEGEGAKIAMHRIIQDLLPAAKRRKRFTREQFEAWAIDLQKFTFEIGGKTPLGPIVGGYGMPHYPALYAKRKVAGHFKEA